MHIHICAEIRLQRIEHDEFGTRFLDGLFDSLIVREEYLNRKISSEEFLRRIDSFGVLEDYEAEKAETVAPNDTDWRKRVERNIDFDPKEAYLPMQVLDLTNGSDAKWQYLTVEDQLRESRGGNESLMDRYERNK